MKEYKDMTEYIKDYKDLDFLKAEIEYEMGVRK